MSKPHYEQPGVVLYHGDCREILPGLEAAHAIVTDPPYELGFMGKEWDRSGVAFEPETWRKCLDALRPGGHLLAFGGSRTAHRIAVAIEDAGFEIRDTIIWLHGQGFPKSHQCLKPAFEPIVVARNPPDGSIAVNVERHGCGLLNIDACRIPTDGPRMAYKEPGGDACNAFGHGLNGGKADGTTTLGRWPANVIHDGSDEVLETFAAYGEKSSDKAGPDGHVRNQPPGNGIYGGGKGLWQEAGPAGQLYGDSGTAARFFYCAKATAEDRGGGNTHPTVKPTALMEYLVRLVTPPGGTVLDPFAGSGTTAVACVKTGFRFVGVELDSGHCDIIVRRLERPHAPVVKKSAADRPLPLFGG